MKGIVLDAVARAIVNPLPAAGVDRATGPTFATESFTVSLSEIEKDKLQRYRPGARLGPMGRISGGSRVW
ncbi:hypothetical protein D3C59_36600 [Streptomyces sp. SHP22-7]|nr:hypothetical protein D3C59_36600 [Streptomyces sp. SHP22-7]